MAKALGWRKRGSCMSLSNINVASIGSMHSIRCRITRAGRTIGNGGKATGLCVHRSPAEFAPMPVKNAREVDDLPGFYPAVAPLSRGRQPSDQHSSREPEP